MIDTLLRFFLIKYEDCDFVLKQKAKALFVMCLTILFIAIPVIIFTITLRRNDIFALLPPITASISIVIILFLLKRGFYNFSVHSVLIVAFSAIWFIICTDDFRRNPIEAMHTVVFILALLTFTPLFITKRKFVIIIYFAVNMIIFTLFLLKIRLLLNIQDKILLEYFLDSAIAFFFIGATSYQIFNISKKSLEKAQVEIERNRELNLNLMQSEETYRNLFHNAQVGLFRTGIKDGTALETNEQNAKMFGYNSREQFIENFVAKDHYVDPNAREKMFSVLMKENGIKNFDAEFRREDGSTFWVRYSARLYHDNGWIEGVAEDITERKQMEEALKKSEEKYRTIIETVEEGYYEVDLSGNFTFVNDALCRISGYTRDQMIGKNFRYNVGDLGAYKIFSVFNKAYQTKQPVKSFDLEFPRKDGYIRFAEASVSFINNDFGQIIGFRGVVRDITERKQAEEALRVQHKLGVSLSGINNLKEALFLILHTALKVKPIDCGCVYLVNSDGGFTLEYSVGLYNLFEKSATSYEKDSTYTSQIMKGKPLYMDFDDFNPTKEGQLSEEGLKAIAIIPVKFHNQVIACMNVASHTSYVIPDTSRSTLETIASLVGNAIKRLRAEEQIKASLQEKEVLLQEIHHRVKNNMQIISSLLSLQSKRITDKELIQLFKDSQNRVRSMALVHEMLYKSEDLSRIDFSKYISNLTAELFRSFKSNPEKIRSIIDAADIYLNINIAIPCALIISELVSNSLKYAFNPVSDGIIQIKFFMRAGNAYTLIVSDNGVGIPHELDHRESETLGLHLVKTLTKQLHGNIALDRNGGTKFTITF
jgi:PAS domain S-box-containing protein